MAKPRTWAINPHSGGAPIPDSTKKITIERLERHAARKYKGMYARIAVRFRGPLCYIDAYREPHKPDAALLRIRHETPEEYIRRMRNYPIHLGRMRHFSAETWSYAFYTYSNDRYEPTLFPNGEWFGSPEQAFDIGAVYLHNDE